MPTDDEFKISLCDFQGESETFFFNVVLTVEKKVLKLYVSDIPIFYENELIASQALIVEKRFSDIKSMQEFIENLSTSLVNKEQERLREMLEPMFKKQKLYAQLPVLPLKSKLSDFLFNVASYYPNLSVKRLRHQFKPQCDICLDNNVVSLKCSYCCLHYCTRCRFRLSRTTSKACYQCRNNYVYK